MGMNVNQLHQHLTMLIAKGHGRKAVCIDSSTFDRSGEDDGRVIHAVASAGEPAWIENCDADGFAVENANGTSSGRMVVILKGGVS